MIRVCNDEGAVESEQRVCSQLWPWITNKYLVQNWLYIESDWCRQCMGCWPRELGRHLSSTFTPRSLLYERSWIRRQAALFALPKWLGLPLTFIFHKWISLGITMLWPRGETHAFLDLAGGLFEFHWNSIKERGVMIFFSCVTFYNAPLHPPPQPTHSTTPNGSYG